MAGIPNSELDPLLPQNTPDPSNHSTGAQGSLPHDSGTDLCISEQSQSDDRGKPQKPQPLRVPKTVLYIIGNEFCERFSFYGQRAILALFLCDHLGLTEDQSTEVVHFNLMLCYAFTLPGAFLSDSYFGKYAVILYLSLAYCLGNWLLSFSAILPEGTSSAHAWAMAGLWLIAIGSGGIKPCVSSFGADQIELTMPPGPDRDKLIVWYFSYFYFAINVGSTVSIILVPILRAYVSYASAFITPALLMMVATLIFWAGHRKYVHQPPAGNLVAQVLEVVWWAWRGPTVQRSVENGGVNCSTESAVLPPTDTAKAPDGYAVLAGGGQSLHDSQKPVCEGFKDRRPGHAREEEIEDKEAPLAVTRLHLRGSKQAVQGQGSASLGPHWLDRAKSKFGEERVEEVKQLLRVLWISLPMPIYWALWDQQATRWLFQATKMDGSLPGGFSVLPDQMQTLNAVAVLLFIPIFDNLIYPAADKAGVPFKAISRMAVGMVLGAISFFMSALVQSWIDQCPSAPTGAPSPHHGAYFTGSGPYSGLGARPQLLPFTSNATAQVFLQSAPAGVELVPCVSLAWQVPQYVLISVSEVLFSITSLEFAYSQAPASMTSVVSAVWLLDDSIGNLFTVFVIGNISPYLTQVQEFIFFGISCLLATVVLAWIGAGFVYMQSCSSQDIASGVPTSSGQSASMVAEVEAEAVIC